MNKYLEMFETLKMRYGIKPDDIQATELTAFLDAQNDKEKPLITESGLAILEYMQNCSATNLKAKDMADGMGQSSRKISGSIRKLFTDGFVEKFGQNPVIYSLTEKGKTFNVTAYKEKLSQNIEE